MFNRIGTIFILMASLDMQAQNTILPEIFLEGIVSTNLNERDMAISPDGTEMYFTIQANQHAFSTILYCKKSSGNTWSTPQVASFSGTWSDLEPAFSPDGTRLFFSSNRSAAGEKVKDFDIWVVEKNKTGWSSPKNLGAPINTPGNEFYPSVGASGNLYFTGEYENGVGKEDIYVSQWTNGSFLKPVPLDTAVNSQLWEFNAFVAPDESYIVFTGYGRKDDQGGGDLYISAKKDGTWQPAKNVSLINSTKLDYCPFVHQGLLYFTSGRHDIPQVRHKAISYGELKSDYNGTTNGSENIYRISLAEALKSLK